MRSCDQPALVVRRLPSGMRPIAPARAEKDGTRPPVIGVEHRGPSQARRIDRPHDAARGGHGRIGRRDDGHQYLICESSRETSPGGIAANMSGTHTESTIARSDGISMQVTPPGHTAVVMSGVPCPPGGVTHTTQYDTTPYRASRPCHRSRCSHMFGLIDVHARPSESSTNARLARLTRARCHASTFTILLGGVARYFNAGRNHPLLCSILVSLRA